MLYGLCENCGSLIGDMRALYAPFLRVEVVGAVADVLLEAYRHAVVREQHIAARRTVGQSHSLLTEISHGVSVGEINGGEGSEVELS